MTEKKQDNIVLAEVSVGFLSVLNQEHELIIQTLSQAENLLREAFSQLVTAVVNVDSLKTIANEQHISKQADEKKPGINFLQMLLLFSEFTAQFQEKLSATIQALQVEDMISQLLRQVIASNEEIRQYGDTLADTSKVLLEKGKLDDLHHEKMRALLDSLEAHQSLLKHKAVLHQSLDDGGTTELF